MSLSKIVLSGKVVRAPEKRFTPSTNTAVTEFAILVESAPRGGSEGPPETATVKVITWRDLAERCAQEIKKGDMVVVDGRLQINNYQSQDGQRRRDVEVDAVAVENLGAAGSGSSSTSRSSSEEGQESQLARAGAKAQNKANKQEDLDAIFASEDEIPF